MFRSPMRLEKWIAYDAALGADLLVVVDPEAEAADAHDAAEGMDNLRFVTGEEDAHLPIVNEDEFPSFDMSGGTKLTDGNNGLYLPDQHVNITVNLPDLNNGSQLFPYTKIEDLLTITDHDGNDGKTGDLWLEITDSGKGDFWFMEKDDAFFESINRMDDFLNTLDTDGNGIPNTSYGTIPKSGYMMFLVPGGDDSSYSVKMYKIVTDSADKPPGSDSVTHYLVETPEATAMAKNITVSRDGDSVKIHVADFNASEDNVLLQGVLQSLTFNGNNINGASVVVSYTVPPNNEGGTGGGSGDDTPSGGGETPPGDENSGGDEPPPQNQPDTGGGDPTDETGESTDDTGEGSESGDSGDSSDSSDGESGDGGDLGGDDLAYVFQDIGDDGMDTESSSEAADSGEESGEAAEQADDDNGDGDTPATAAAAEQLELTRDMEFLLTAVQNDRDVLLGLIGRLESEYLARDPEDYGELRDYLRRLFDMGKGEEDTVNRIIDAMNREMDVFRAAAPGQRDGMLTESVRELIASAERHSGEMGAYSRAVEAVADVLADRRLNNLPPPSDGETSALFATEYEAALSAWQASTERVDPMGRDFTAMRRVAGAEQGMPGE